MDLVRSCYRSKMRLFSDRPDVEVEGQWYFAKSDAKYLPFPHVFTSQNWDPSTADIDPSVGEVLGRRAWVPGRLPGGQDGQHFCGDASAWQNGVPIADRGLPIVRPDGSVCACPITNCLSQENAGHILLEQGDGCIEPEYAGP